MRDLTFAAREHSPRLFPIAPVGRGTGRIESLTGYIARLARAHRMQTGRLVTETVGRHVLAKRTSETGDRPLHSWETASLSGSGNRSVIWTEVLEELTSVPGLSELTVSSWTAIVPPQHLLRRDEAYCPDCFADDLRHGEPYERLVWLVSGVDLCIRHGRRLLTVCLYCRRTRSPLSPWSLPGYCAFCGRWLGSHRGKRRAEAASDEWSTRTAWLVEDALANRAGTVASAESVRNSLAVMIDMAAGGNRARFATIVGVGRSTVQDWFSRSRPTLGTLLRAAAVTGSDLTSLLEGQPRLGRFPPLALPADVSRQTHRRVDWDEVERTLDAEAKRDRPASMTAFLRVHALDRRQVRRYKGAAAATLIERAKQRRDAEIQMRRADRLAKLESTVEGLKRSSKVASRRAIESELGPGFLRRRSLREVWHRLR